jgi:nitrite reductase/ring-hydroxylating ferredoxin subunit
MAFVCKSGALKPGQVAAFEVENRILAVANVDGTFFAVDNDCPHAGCSLSQGDLWGKVINCPCHGGQFDLETGEVVGGPSREPVRCHALLVEGDDVVTV